LTVNQSEGNKEKIENIRSGGVVDYSSHGQRTKDVNILLVVKDSLDRLHDLLDLYSRCENILVKNDDGIKIFSDELVELFLKAVIYTVGEEGREVITKETLPNGSEQRLKAA
jgi:hypothetical protein